MDKFRDKIKLQILVNAIGIGLLLLVNIVAFSRTICPEIADSHWADMWNGFMAGAAIGVMALLLVGLVKSIRALKNEAALKKMYVEANDERQQIIYTEARSAGTQVFLIGGLVVGIAAGYFSVSVSITIIACVFIHSLICAAFKVYYGKKY